ncbi:MAG: glycogen synthase GlgA [Burkholderiales bacterium]
MKRLAVLSVASEVFPLAKTGGLADVTGSLPGALAAESVAVRTILPGYGPVLAALGEADTVHAYPELQGGAARILAARAAGLDLFVLDAPHLYRRPGGLYAGPDGGNWPDNSLRFAALSAAAADIGRGIVPAFVPDIVHAHDWQAGLAPAYLHYGGGARPRTVMTVHNLAFQGQFPASLLAQLGLPGEALAFDGVEYYGAIGYLKAGLQLADRITTVSPRYAMEIRTPEFGMGLDGLLRHRASVLTGILNGIDTAYWDPAKDPCLAANFDARNPAGRAANKAALQARLGLDPGAATPLFGVVSRLTWQKGMDLLLENVPALVALGAQLALVGSGEAELEAGFAAAAAAHPGRVGVLTGFDEPLAHLVQGGADALLVPSRFEPCGLAQLCALRYGAIPVASRVGGLADTVIDANEMALVASAGNGLQFSPVTVEGLALALERAVRLYEDRTTWRRLQRHAMAADVGWRRAAKAYAALYRELLAARAA